MAKNFREIFAELVPGGKGELVMQKRLGAPAVTDDDENDAEGGGRDGASEKYSGVKVKVGHPVLSLPCCSRRDFCSGTPGLCAHQYKSWQIWKV